MGVTKHELEDYLIKLMLEDESLRPGVTDLRQLILEIVPIIRSHDGLFDSGKEIFQLIKPIVQHGFSDTGVIRKLIGDANADILRSVLAPVLKDLEQSLGM